MDHLFSIGGSLLAGLVLGLVLAGFYFRARISAAVAAARSTLEIERAGLLEQLKIIPELKARAQEAADLRTRMTEIETRLEAERQAAAEKLALLEEARTALAHEFKALSAQALNVNNEQFMTLAKATLEKYQEGARGELARKEQAISELVKPVRESLDKVDGKIQELERERARAYQGLIQQVQSLLEAQRHLRLETGNLAKALHSPVARGRWGELQLRRVVEMAGMIAHCDFEEQATVTNQDGRQRPDLVVRLPGGRRILVDAKTPLQAYLEASECADEPRRKELLARHIQHIRDHIASLGRKAYWEQFTPAPEFVILFLPGESFFSAALQGDPELIEAGLKEKVLLATPITLIALLRAVAYGWRQEKLAENAQQISDLGRELYKRLSDMGEHWSRVGKGLEDAIKSFNRATGSLESRVLPTARKFKELHAAPENADIEELGPIEQSARALQAPELQQRDFFGK